MLHLAATGTDRDVEVSVHDGRVAVAAVAYEERTGTRHFDLGLPLLAAVPASIGGPEGSLMTSTLAALALALGLYRLLVRQRLPVPAAMSGASLTVLLAPVSPYAVRLYTEVLAAALVVWALVCVELVGTRPRLLVPFLALTGALPFVHGRYTPLAVMLLVVCGARLPARYRRHALTGGGVVALLLVAAVLAGSSALRERASPDYFRPEWVAVSSAGILLDRGSGLIPFAPWCVLALAAPKPLSRLQRGALLLIGVQFSIVALRAGGWQTFGAPARYILPVVPLLALLAVPAALALWQHRSGRAVTLTALGFSVVSTALLHWVPLSGYVTWRHWLIDDLFTGVPGFDPYRVFPHIQPEASPAWLGLAMLACLAIALVWMILRTDAHERNSR